VSVVRNAIALLFALFAGVIIGAWVFDPLASRWMGVFGWLLWITAVFTAPTFNKTP